MVDIKHKIAAAIDGREETYENLIFLLEEARSLIIKLDGEIDYLNNEIKKEAKMKVDHSLKTEQPWFDLVAEGVKNFEIRKNDRGFKKGDILELLEYDAVKKEFTEDYILAKVELVCEYAQKEGWVVLGIKVLSVSVKGTA